MLQLYIALSQFWLTTSCSSPPKPSVCAHELRDYLPDSRFPPTAPERAQAFQLAARPATLEKRPSA
jgi:hypothetical protein